VKGKAAPGWTYAELWNAAGDVMLAATSPIYGP
jgi:hypothetical protein